PLTRADVFHRPNQFLTLHELTECFAYGRRLVLTQQDMTLDRAPGYFTSRKDWEELCRTTKAALASADQVGFFSEHAAVDAARDGLLDTQRATVVPLGVDHVRTDGKAELPARLARLGGRPFLLMIGAALPHKNRLVALPLLRGLAFERGWGGGLVLAGARRLSGHQLDSARAATARKRSPSVRAGSRPRRRLGERETRALPQCRTCPLSVVVRGVRPRPVRGGCLRHALSVRMAWRRVRVPAVVRGIVSR